MNPKTLQYNAYTSTYYGIFWFKSILVILLSRMRE